MKKKSKFYAIYGTNGCAVADSMEVVVQISHYLCGEHCKGFGSFEEAESWAVSGFALSPRFPVGAYVPTPLRLNRAVFLKDLGSFI